MLYIVRLNAHFQLLSVIALQGRTVRQGTRAYGGRRWERGLLTEVGGKGAKENPDDWQH